MITLYYQGLALVTLNAFMVVMQLRNYTLRTITVDKNNQATEWFIWRVFI